MRVEGLKKVSCSFRDGPAAGVTCETDFPSPMGFFFFSEANAPRNATRLIGFYDSDPESPPWENPVYVWRGGSWRGEPPANPMQHMEPQHRSDAVPNSGGASVVLEECRRHLLDRAIDLDAEAEESDIKDSLIRSHEADALRYAARVLQEMGEQAVTREVSLVTATRRLKHELNFWQSCILDAADDRLYHAEDDTWWRRESRTGVVILVAAEPPKGWQRRPLKPI